MRKIALLVTIFFGRSLMTSAQEDPAPIGYKLKKSDSVVYVWRNKDGKPDLTVWNKWNHSYWFKLDNTDKGYYKDSDTKVEYIRVTIESDKRYDDNKKDWTDQLGYNVLVPWTQGEYIDGSDFNTWLWIRKVDFTAYKTNYYAKVYGRVLLSGLTVPFKYRPAVNSQPNGMINGDINLGTFAGVRFGFGDKGGFSLGGSLGVSSLSQNASTNTALTGNQTETLQGFNYGLAAIFDWQKKFQIGAVMGYDYGMGNLAKTYVYQQKKWFSISLNYKFLDFGKGDAATNKDAANNAEDKSKTKR